MDPQGERSEFSWRWLRRIGILVLLAIPAGIILISSGLFDPRPLGNLEDEYQLEHLLVEAGSSILIWLDEPIISGPMTLRLLAAREQGETDVAYGMAIGKDEDKVIVALSPVGYVTIQRWLVNSGTVEVEQYIPWQTWPHIQTGDLENEIWIDIEKGVLTSIRVNRELLWQGEIQLTGNRIGLSAESYGGSTEVNFETLKHFYQK